MKRPLRKCPIYTARWEPVLQGLRTELRVVAQPSERRVKSGIVFGDLLIYEIGQCYPIYPSVEFPSVGSVRLMRTRGEFLQDIDRKGLIAENVYSREIFRALWDTEHQDCVWEDNPRVWVLNIWPVDDE